jgi:hypothetical protein
MLICLATNRYLVFFLSVDDIVCRPIPTLGKAAVVDIQIVLVSVVERTETEPSWVA